MGLKKHMKHNSPIAFMMVSTFKMAAKIHFEQYIELYTSYQHLFSFRYLDYGFK